MFRFGFGIVVALLLLGEVAAIAVLSFVMPGASEWYLTLAIPLTFAGAAFLQYSNSISSRARRLSPEDIIDYRPPEPGRQTDSPEEISRSIVERTAEIRRTLGSRPSEVQVEMCALGYRACVNDMITLTNLANEELPKASFTRRFVLRRARRRATEALAMTKSALPTGALRAVHEEHK